MEILRRQAIDGTLVLADKVLRALSTIILAKAKQDSVPKLMYLASPFILLFKSYPILLTS